MNVGKYSPSKQRREKVITALLFCCQKEEGKCQVKSEQIRVERTGEHLKRIRKESMQHRLSVEYAVRKLIFLINIPIHCRPALIISYRLQREDIRVILITCSLHIGRAIGKNRIN